ncbi:MAG: hypothetical protein NZM04_00955 [Methylacidiphilales bacterium]|nr:hypothetical protein [Candidatus Methylacidiphilales bacterium]
MRPLCNAGIGGIPSSKRIRVIRAIRGTTQVFRFMHSLKRQKRLDWLIIKYQETQEFSAKGENIMDNIYNTGDLKSGQFLTVQDFFKLCPVGASMFDTVLVPNLSDKYFFRFNIKEDQYHINAIKKMPIFAIRLAMFKFKHVKVGVIMCKCSEIQDCLYECYINLIHPEDRQAIHALIDNTKIMISLYDKNSENVHNFTINNYLQETANKILHEFNPDNSWSDFDFNLAKKMMQKKYSTCESLWQAMSL